MPAALATPSIAKPRNRSIEARHKARVGKATRERRVIDLLNGGVPVAEIADRLGVTEKRTRAIVREILARRRPGAPEDYVALQVSRLNEALLVAYGAMSAENLRAVGLVVRIVRELDRYHGFVAAETRSLADARAPTAGPDPRVTREVEGKAEEPFALLTRPLKAAPQAPEKAGETPGRVMDANGPDVAAGPRSGEGAQDRSAADAPLAEGAQTAPPAPEKPQPASDIDVAPNAPDGAVASLAEPRQATSALDAPLMDSPQTAPEVPENVQNAPGNDGTPDASDGAVASLAEPEPPSAPDAPLTDSPQAAPQAPDNVPYAPGEPIPALLAASAEESYARETVTRPIEIAPHAGVGASPPLDPAGNPNGFRLLRVRMIPNGISAC